MAYAPKFFTWNGKNWSNDSGQTWNDKVTYAITLEGGKVRMELHDTPNDCGQHDMTVKETFKRRAEIGNTANKFLNNHAYWHAFSFFPHWSDPAAMKTSGHTIMQMHWPSGNSPAFSFRLVGHNGGAVFRITTRGDGQGNITRVNVPLVLEKVHDVVYSFTLNGKSGVLKVWIDGQLVASLSGIPIGSLKEDGYGLRFGPYGQPLNGNLVVMEYGNIADFPLATDLSGRIHNPPAW